MPEASGVYHVNDEGDETVNEIVDAIANHVSSRPDIRHVPIDEARAKLGPYADALALDQRLRSRGPERSGGHRRCAASPATSRGYSRSIETRGDAPKPKCPSPRPRAPSPAPGAGAGPPYAEKMRYLVPALAVLSLARPS